jgi:hypothetical protein
MTVKKKTAKKAVTKKKVTKKRSKTKAEAKNDVARQKIIEITGAKDIQVDDILEKAKKRGVGRPTVYEPDVHPYALEMLLAEGYSFEASCGALNICKDTGYRWVKEYPEFSDAKKRGEAQGQIWWEREGKRGMNFGKDFNATVWVFSMKNRFDWSDKKDLNLGGQPGNPININNSGMADYYDQLDRMSDEEIDKQIAAIQKKKRSKK